MSKLTTQLNIKTNIKDKYSGSAAIDRTIEMIDDYETAISLKEIVDNSDTFIKIIAAGSSIAGVKASAGARLIDAKLIIIKNCGQTAVELSLEKQTHTASSQAPTGSMFTTIILAPKDFMVLPNQRIADYSALESAGNHIQVDNADTSDLKTDSGMDLDDASGNSIINHLTRTNLQLTPYTSAAVCAANNFRVGDTIRVDNEIMKVTAIGTKADLANNDITVTRGQFGSAAATDGADGDAVEFAFFNEYNDFDKFSKCQTNESGKYKTSNFILNAQRSSKDFTRGIVRGSFSLKFYESGYQELGLSGLTTGTSSGLAVSTAYQFNITANGGSVLVNLAFTTDASNVNFGGNNGILSKIQEALNTAYNTYGGNLYEQKVIISLVNGDVRFTAESKTSVSAILLAAPGAGTTPFGVGRFPAIADVEAPVAAKLPDDTILTTNNIEKPNVSAFAWDDGEGNIIGAATGTINYENSSIDIKRAPALAEFVASFNCGSVHSGGINETATFQNGLIAAYARSVNSKINGEVEIIGFM